MGDFDLSFSDAVSLFEVSCNSMNDLFEITIDVSNANNITTENVYYGFANSNVFNNILFGRGSVVYGEEHDLYIDQTIRRDVSRHVQNEIKGSRVIDATDSGNVVSTGVTNLNTDVYAAFASLASGLNQNGTKLASDISGDIYEYYYNLSKFLLEKTLNETPRLDILNADISLALANNPGAQQITVYLKFIPGDAIAIRINYKIQEPANYVGTIQDKSYKLLLKLS